MKIGIIGVGYVGLVTGACFSHVGNDVYCMDIDVDKINNLKKGKVPIYEDKLDDIISESISLKRIQFTSEIKDIIKNSKIIFLAVSTPMNDDGSCKLDYIMNAATEIGKYMDENKVIVVKSTVPVGTTQAIKEKILDELRIRKLEKDIEFDIVNNPEFLKEGKAIDDFLYPDRVIIGLENSTLKDLFRELYRPFSVNHDKIIFLDIPSSELTKYAANAMLAMKISFINEISQFCEKVGANINDVRKGIGSDKRIGYDFIYPSIGFGGSCFPKDVNSLKMQFKKVGLNSLMSDATLNINVKQRKNFKDRILLKFKNTNLKEKLLTVWGVTFKPDTDDIRESQAVKIIDDLLMEGFKINVYDPKGMDNAKRYYDGNKNIAFFEEKYNSVKKSDALLLLTEWKEFRTFDFKKIKETMNQAIIFDGRNIYNKKELGRYGITYYQVGVGEIE